MSYAISNSTQVHTVVHFWCLTRSDFAVTGKILRPVIRTRISTISVIACTGVPPLG